jgi:cytochrome c oxidase subunit II
MENCIMKLRKRILPALLALSLVTQIASVSMAQEAINTIEIHAHRFSFTPAEITLKKGETVKLRLISDDVAHSLVVPALKINAPMVKSHPTEITVTPDSTGDFHGQCGKFCGSGHGSMLFTVHVKD